MGVTGRRLGMLGLPTVIGWRIVVWARVQPLTAVLQVALLPQWTIHQHRGPSPALQPVEWGQ